MDQEQRPAWPPERNRVDRLLGHHWTAFAAAILEAFVWPMTELVPPFFTFLMVYAGSVIVRSHRMDRADQLAEAPVVILRPYNGLAGHHHPEYRPSGSLLRNLPVESGGSFYHVDFHVINEGNRDALLEAEGRAEGQGGRVVLSHALWSVLEGSASAPPPRVEDGVEFLPVPAGVHLRARLSVYIGPRAAEKMHTPEQAAELKRRTELGEPWYVHMFSMQQLEFWVWDRMRCSRDHIKVQVLKSAVTDAIHGNRDIPV